jgi:hypothetical protein
VPFRRLHGAPATAVHSASRGRISGAGGFVGPKTPRHTAYVISTLPALDRQALGREQLVAAARGVALSPRCTGHRRPSSAHTLPTAQARRSYGEHVPGESRQPRTNHDPFPHRAIQLLQGG